MFEPHVLVLIGLLGLVAGCLGGLLGVGGSVIMLPGLVMILGRDNGGEQHLYQAAAMLVNVAVAWPAARRHAKAGVVRPDVLKWMMPAALVAVLGGVAASNLPVFQGDGAIWLGRVLSVFLVYVVVLNISKIAAHLKKARLAKEAAAAAAANGSGGAAGSEHAGLSGDAAHSVNPSAQEKVTPFRATGMGVVMGGLAGLLGIGGGGLAVPLQQVWMKLPLRSCIGNSSSVMLVSAGLGAVFKNATLPAGQTVGHSLLIAGLLAPTAFIGSRLGAGWTHKLPLVWVRVVFVCLMVVAAWKMAGF